MKSWIGRIDFYQSLIIKIEPSAIVVTKDHWFWSALWWLGNILTFFTLQFFLSKKTFLEDKATSIGPFHGYPRQWEKLSKKLIMHEGRHSWHCVLLGWSIPILGWFFGRRVRAIAGVLPYAIIYFFIIFPIGLAVGRLLIEADAERVTYIYMAKNRYNDKEIYDRAYDQSKKVCGPHYFYSFPHCIGQKIFMSHARRAIERWMR